LRTAVGHLLEAGYSKVVVLADHGFILLPDPPHVSVLSSVPSDDSIARARRYAVGRPPELEGTVRTVVQNLGYEGDLSVIFPDGLAVLGLQGELPRFLHGGPLPCETALLFLVCKAGEAMGRPILVRIVGPERIETMRPRIRLLAKSPESILYRRRTVRVEIYVGSEEVARSEPVTLSEPGGEAVVPLTLTRYEDEVEARLVDVNSNEVVARKRLPVTLPRGYTDEVS
jgi:hypothetical protein